ncbi:NERD domain-containing protein [Clostridium sp. YIM B02505]|uniref:NERD domain-containing protein n=1 Tax=Clostridium yunnanense TaxID=2800325 RepID=A0ABS1EKI4_9CLOT|nr:nuclease-related domain-containing protein [Clostridium yunnanense]MBK1809864.1 NERD domain-containing protein [Clostridium yunnanense]
MNVLVELFMRFWYLWILIVLAFILDLFMPRIKGFLGERSVEFYLAQLDVSKYEVINNITVKLGDNSTQIDSVVVSNFGIFVLQSENYKGKITGEELDENWCQKLHVKKEKLHNPIRENYKHIQVLKEVLKEFDKLKYISIVTFTTNADLQVTSNSDVVYTIHLLETIKRYTEEVISDVDKKKIHSKLMSLDMNSNDNYR